MNPITSSIAASCSRLNVSPRSSPRGSPRSSPRSSPNVVRRPPFLDIPNDVKRRDSKEIQDYKKELYHTTSKAYQANKTGNRKTPEINVRKVKIREEKQKPAKRLLEEAVHATAADRKRKTSNAKRSGTSKDFHSKKGKNCSIM